MLVFVGLLRIIGKERLQMIITLGVFCPLIILSESFLVLVLHLDIYGIKLGSFISSATTSIILFILYNKHEKQFLDKLEESKAIEEEEMNLFEKSN